MKLSKKHLKQLIREEYKNLVESRQSGLDWDDFEDMSDLAEAYDWLDRNGITVPQEQDQFVELWELGDATALEYEDIHTAFKGLRR